MNRKKARKLTIGKKRPPHAQLIDAGKEAKKMLIKKGFQLPDDQSFIENLKKKGIWLPGIPEYVPRPWTIKTSQRILIDIAREWEHDTPVDNQENISEFFKTALKILNEEFNKINKKMKTSKRVKEFDLALISQRDTLQGIRKLFADTFAISIIVKSNTEVSTFVEWYFEWASKLLKEWGDK